MSARPWLPCAALFGIALLIACIASPVSAGTEPPRASATLREDDPPAEPAAEEAAAPEAEAADYIALSLPGEQDIAAAPEQEEQPARWGNAWRGALEYRYTHVEHADGVGEYARDAAFDLAYTLSAPRAWEFGLGLATRRENKPGTNWIALDELTGGTVPLAPYYWLRKDWAGASESQLRVQLGRFTYPFDISQITIDNDLLMRGGYVQYTLPRSGFSGPDRIRLSLLGAQLLDGRLESTAPARLLSCRVDARWEPDESRRTDAALTYHEFLNADTIGEAVAGGAWRVGGPAGSGETTNFTLDEQGGYASDFHILGVWLNTSLMRQTSWPLSIEGEYTRNLVAAGAGDGAGDAYYAALDIGRRDQPGAWQFGVDHAYVEADAALAAVNRGEYATDYAGTRLSTRYCPAAGVECRLAYTWSSSLSAADTAVQFDDEELDFTISLSF